MNYLLGSLFYFDIYLDAQLMYNKIYNILCNTKGEGASFRSVIVVKHKNIKQDYNHSQRVFTDNTPAIKDAINRKFILYQHH